MGALFLVLAVAGGTILVCQFVLTLVGLSGGHDVADEISTDHMGDASGHDFHVDGDHGGDAAHDHAHEGSNHGAHWLFGVISFRTLVAASTFFGLAGLAAQEAGQGLGIQLAAAVVCGGAAMYGVHSIIRMFGRLGFDGTVRIQRALGQEGTVYIPIPAGGTRAGKVQLKVQNRLMEYAAVTAAPDRLATGTKVRVTGIAGDVLEVTPVHPSA